MQILKSLRINTRVALEILVMSQEIKLLDVRGSDPQSLNNCTRRGSKCYNILARGLMLGLGVVEKK